MGDAVTLKRLKVPRRLLLLEEHFENFCLSDTKSAHCSTSILLNISENHLKVRFFKKMQDWILKS